MAKLFYNVSLISSPPHPHLQPGRVVTLLEDHEVSI